MHCSPRKQGKKQALKYSLLFGKRVLFVCTKNDNQSKKIPVLVRVVDFFSPIKQLAGIFYLLYCKVYLRNNTA